MRRVSPLELVKPVEAELGHVRYVRAPAFPLHFRHARLARWAKLRRLAKWRRKFGRLGKHGTRDVTLIVLALILISVALWASK